MSNLIPFLQDLIRIPSLTKTPEERQCAQRVAREMGAVGFDHAWVDEANNVIGVYRGQQRGPAWLLLTHVDVVSEGDPSLWATPPFDAVEIDGVIHGRGAVDIKGPLASHVYTVAAMRAEGVRPLHDVVVLAAAGEETTGDGAKHFVDHLPLVLPDGERVMIGACVVSEPSGNRVMLGHRGVMRTFVRFHGRAHHASLALSDENPHFALPAFLQRLAQAQWREHPVLGRTTVAPTLITADTRSQNLTPNVIELLLDVRYGDETQGDFERAFAALTEGLNATCHIHPAEAHGPVVPRYFGPDGMNAGGFIIEPGHALVAAIQAAVVTVRGEATPPPGVWEFCTDGRITHMSGIPTVGFGPGDPRLAHTTDERIAVAEIEEAIAVFAQLLVHGAPV